MNHEHELFTQENFLNLPDEYFYSIDKRIVSVSKAISLQNESSQMAGYRLLADYGDISYLLRIGLALKPSTGQEVVVIWHEILNISNGPNFESSYQKIVEWWKSTHPMPLFDIGVNTDSKKVLLGIDVPTVSISKISTKNLISRLIEIIPGVEAKVKELSS